MHILVIDDEPNIRDTITDLLEVNGYQVVAAANGADGYASALHSAPACIITDIRMPVMDGYGLIRACRAEPRLRRIPIIVASGFDARNDIRRAMDDGADDYISKPFTEEEVLRSLKARLEKKELIDELDAFAHTAAHDLRSPLWTLGVRLELVTRSIQAGHADMALKQVAAAAESADQMKSIIEELLLLSGVRHQVVESESLDMGAIFHEATDRLSAALQATGAEIAAPTQWPVAFGHGPWLIHVWMNLLSNAAKYAGPNARITVGSAPSGDGQHVRFWVQDQGPGLSVQAQRQMFAPFTSLSNVRAKGTGLGLSIVRRIVEKLKGRVGVDSEEGHGACFWFELPAAAVPTKRVEVPMPCMLS